MTKTVGDTPLIHAIQVTRETKDAFLADFREVCEKHNCVIGLTGESPMLVIPCLGKLDEYIDHINETSEEWSVRKEEQSTEEEG